MLDLGLAPKQARRASAQLLYFKDSASVEDFLTRIGAPHAAMELMQAKVEKNLRNTINRQVNCETANLVKAADASARQIAAIKSVLREGGEEAFPDNLRETVRLRLSDPTDSLTELARAVRSTDLQAGTEPQAEKDNRICCKGELNGTICPSACA